MNLNPSQIFDLVVLIVIAIFAILGAIKGFFKSCIGFAVIAGSIFIGFKVAPPVTPKVVEWLYPRISDKLLNFATKRGLNLSGLTQEQTDSLLKSLMTPATRICTGIVIALVCMLILGFLGTLIGKMIDKAPGIKGANSVLGAVLGAATAFIICYLLVFAAVKLGMGDYFAQTFDSSIAYRILYSCIPKTAGSIGIDLPFIGEINLKDLFKNEKIGQ
ncbi:MAG: CvpA family protein [Firmicutes bacterium]|nr:CvpA family protein [Bacillota bacterium]